MCFVYHTQEKLALDEEVIISVLKFMDTAYCFGLVTFASLYATGEDVFANLDRRCFNLRKMALALIHPGDQHIFATTRSYMRKYKYLEITVCDFHPYVYAIGVIPLISFGLHACCAISYEVTLLCM